MILNLFVTRFGFNERFHKNLNHLEQLVFSVVSASELLNLFRLFECFIEIVGAPSNWCPFEFGYNFW